MVVLPYSPHHQCNASIADLDTDFSLLRCALRVGDTYDGGFVGRHHVAHGACDGHFDFIVVGAAMSKKQSCMRNYSSSFINFIFHILNLHQM